MTGGLAIASGTEGISSVLWNVGGCNSSTGNILCYLAAMAYAGGAGAATWWYSSPAATDLTPGSSFLNSLNPPATNETFERAGVVSYTPLFMDEYRIFDNAVTGIAGGCYPEAACGEDNAAFYAEVTYFSAAAVFSYALFQLIEDPNQNPLWLPILEYSGTILGIMEGMDVFWNLIVSGYQSSDAIVETTSETYPNGNNYPIQNADSHTGATTSILVHPVLKSVLAGEQFHVPLQASCTFQPNPTSYAISGNGGNSSFGLTTGSGCNWSVVGQKPWPSVTSANSGNSSTTVSFSVAANPTTIPRKGTISAGTDNGSVLFTVYQGGVCLYSINPSYIELPPGGGAATINVSTSNECVWSAVPDETWLSITAGASGTGSGSFTLDASTPTADSFSGSVTVMDQTFPVIVGSSSGTPSTGTVTISGSPQSVTVNMCPNSYPYYCPETISEGGNVSVTVAGVTFTMGYESTASQMASDLANVINNTSGSPVGATVSNSTITLISKRVVRCDLNPLHDLPISGHCVEVRRTAGTKEINGIVRSGRHQRLEYAQERGHVVGQVQFGNEASSAIENCRKRAILDLTRGSTNGRRATSARRAPLPSGAVRSVLPRAELAGDKQRTVLTRQVTDTKNNVHQIVTYAIVDPLTGDVAASYLKPEGRGLLPLCATGVHDFEFMGADNDGKLAVFEFTGG